MTYKIKRVREHFEVYIDDKFYCSADDQKEAAKEIEDYFKGGDFDENQSA